ncbi:MAG: hypothetical protein ACYSOW_00020 [Planctomycetota bacterium]
MIENSDMPNKEVILQQVKPAVSDQSAVTSKQKKKDKLAASRDFVNTVSK